MQHAVGVGTDRLCEERVPPFGCPAGRVVREFEVRPTPTPATTCRFASNPSPLVQVCGVNHRPRAMTISAGDMTTFVTRPLSLSLLIIAALLLVVPLLLRLRSR